MDGLAFDLGMVMLEPHSTPADPCHDLQTYDPKKLYDWTRFGHLASDWLNNQVALRRVSTPTCQVDGKIGPDFLLSNRLDVFSKAGLSGPPNIDPHSPLHARNKLSDGAYDRATYAQAADWNHGTDVQKKYFEPFVRKVTCQQSNQLLARQHRALWVPLYYPETMTSALKGAPHTLKEYPFWTTDSGCISTWIRDMYAEVVASPTANVNTSPISEISHGSTGWTVNTNDGAQWNATDTVMSLPMQRCSQLLGVAPHDISNRISISIFLCSIAAEKIRWDSGCHMIVDEDFAIFRITSPERQAGRDSRTLRLVAEASPAVLRQRYPHLDPAAAIREELVSLLQLSDPNDLVIHKGITAQDALALPSHDDIHAANQYRENLQDHAPG
ncbi:MAG: hypothetical protein EON54_25555, partial [Alcaligenaceae bacterium]